MMTPTTRRPRSRRGRRRSFPWGAGVLSIINSQAVVAQDELDALEALCFLSAAAHQHPHPQQQRTHTTKRSPCTKQQQPSRASARARQQQLKQQQQQQRPARKQQREQQQQPASNSTSSGVTHSAHAAELAEQQQLAVEDIHPAALPDPRLVAGVVQQQQQQASVQQLQPTATAVMPKGSASPQELQQVQAQYASWPAGVVGGGVPLPHLLLPPAPAAPPAAADVAALQQLAALAAVTSAGSSLDVGGLVQQLASLAPVAPLMQGLLAPVLHQVPPQPQPQPPVAVPRPPVKGCFWHVYIANMIESARKQEEQQQQQPQAALPIPPPARAANKRAAMMPPPRPPAPPTAGQDAALHKKRRMQQQQQAAQQAAHRQQVAAAANPLAGVKAADPLAALLACSTAPGVGGLLGGLLGLPPVAAASLPLLGGQLARPAGGGLPAMQLFGGLQASPLLPLLPALAGMHGLAGC